MFVTTMLPSPVGLSREPDAEVPVYLYLDPFLNLYLVFDGRDTDEANPCWFLNVASG